MASKYNPKKIEEKWQEYWLENQVFFAQDEGKKPKKYVLVEFPYPSGAGLHMGHLRPYVAADVYSRYFRHKGFNVLFPIGWDAFGLPAENYAIKTGVHPSITTAQNIGNAKKQMLSWGLSFDFSREVNTTDPNYYKWTQWIFLQFFKEGLAYESTGLINWCPKDKTGLANEEVIDGKCERCGTEVEKKELRQWYLRITRYAEKLLEGLKTLDKWPDAVKTQQANWIGKSVGAEIAFGVIPSAPEESRDSSPQMHSAQNDALLDVNIFTTRPDTIFGATYLVLAPEHASIEVLKDSIQNWEEVAAYIEKAKAKKEIERTAEGKDKTGVELKGVKAVNPATGQEIPVWVADYVLGNYGTGAIMAVPAHDERDFEFAQKFGLPIKQVVWNPISPIKSYLMGGSEISDQDLTDIGIEIVETLKDGNRKCVIPAEAIAAYEKLIESNLKPGFWNEYVGQQTVFIFKHKDGKVERLILDDQTKGKINQLAEQFADTKFIDPWSMIAGNDWYKDAVIHAEYGTLINSGEFTGMKSEEAIPKMAEKFGKLTAQYKLRDWVFSRQRYWGEPIPIVHCGKCGVVPVPEEQLPVVLPQVEKYEPTGTGESPLASIEEWVNTSCPKCNAPAKRETNTMPQWAGSSWYWLRYADPHNGAQFASKEKQSYWTPVDVYFGGMEHTTLHLLYSRFWNLFLYDQGLVTSPEPYLLRKPHGIVLGPDGEKMSKSRGNVVNPDELVEKFGADSVRMYELFLGPHEAMVSWNDKGILGVRRFLERVFTWATEIEDAPHDRKAHPEESEKVQIALNKLIKKVTEDIENYRFNTAVSSFMEFHNEVKQDFMTLESVKKFLVLLSPFAPHLCEELFQHLGFTGKLEQETWPSFDEAKTVNKEVEIVVQINGKVKAKISVATGSTEETVKALAVELDAVKKSVSGAPIKKSIFVPDKLINLVV